MNERIGFMQGRLSPLVDGKIQAFPWEHWRQEFLSSKSLDIHLMEWTLDQDHLYENPLMTEAGRSEIRVLCANNRVRIPSLTGDCFMQAPFWKASGDTRVQLERDFIAITQSCYRVGISILVVPLVDSGGLDNIDQENQLIQFFEAKENYFSSCNIQIAFESDYSPKELSRFIKKLNPAVFGINYDIGNSAALGFNVMEEFCEYGERIINVHVKDRILGGTTVPLGSGNADFSLVFSELSKIQYKGNFILQTARAVGDEHARILSSYYKQTIRWIQNYAT